MLKDLLDGLLWRIIILVGIVGGTAVYLWFSGLDWRSKKEKSTQTELERVAEQLDQALVDGRYDRSAEGQSKEKDAWGHEIKVIYEQEGVGERLKVVSSGKDGQFDTDDDLVASRWLLNATGIGDASKTYAGDLAKEVAKNATEGVKESVKDSIKKRLPWMKSEEAGAEGEAVSE